MSMVRKFFILFILFSACPAQSIERLVEFYSDPRTAALGFTGVAECLDFTCLDFNPAQLTPGNSEVNTSYSYSFRFNERLYDIIDEWGKTRDLFTSKQYEEILNTSWRFTSRQTGNFEFQTGYRVQGFAFQLIPMKMGAIFIAHDPVLPVAELTFYQLSAISLGYGWLANSPLPQFTQNLRLGVSLKYSFGETNHIDVNPFENTVNRNPPNKFHWVTARAGATAQLVSPHLIEVSGTLSGIPLFRSMPDNLPNADALDFQPGISGELYRFRLGSVRAMASWTRLFRDESFWLKNHFGISGSFRKFQMALGLSDAMLTYGIDFHFPLIRIGFASYGVEYSKFSHNTQDRIYWVKMEI